MIHQKMRAFQDFSISPPSQFSQSPHVAPEPYKTDPYRRLPTHTYCELLRFCTFEIRRSLATLIYLTAITRGRTHTGACQPIPNLYHTYTELVPTHTELRLMLKHIYIGQYVQIASLDYLNGGIGARFVQMNVARFACHRRPNSCT